MENVFNFFYKNKLYKNSKAKTSKKIRANQEDSEAGRFKNKKFKKN